MDLSGTNHWGQNNIQNDAKQSQSKSNLQVTDEENKYALCSLLDKMESSVFTQMVD